MSGFQSFQAPDVVPVNSLFNLGDAQRTSLQNQQTSLANQTTQNALNDAQTVRDNAVGVAQGDPTATATSLAADPVRAQGILDGLKTQDTNTRARVAWALGQAGQNAQAVLNLPDEQKQGAWTALRNQAISSGENPSDLPAQVPDNASLVAFRKSAIPATALLDHQSTIPTPSGADPADVPTPVSVPGGGGQPQASNGGPTPSGSYSQALAKSESGGNYQQTNNAGYLGAYQFGAARLQDLGVYQPAQGENVENNTYDGTFDIPGFPQVKTADNFLHNPAAQNAVQGMSTHDIHAAIQQLPNAGQFSEAGLQAVAHLGGKTGMERFAETYGTAHPYDRADSNGTRLSDYYQRFAGLGTISQGSPASSATTPPASSGSGAPTAPASSGSGAPATYAATGTTPPPGMPTQVADAPTSGSSMPAAPSAAAPASTSAPVAPAAPGFTNMLADLDQRPGGSMASGPGTQTASLTGTTGLPATATDATSSAAGGSPQNQLVGVGNPQPAGAPGPQQATTGAPPGQNPLAGVGAPPPPAAAPAQLGVRPLYQGGKFIPVGAPELGQILAVDAAGNRTTMRIPGFTPKISFTNVDGNLVGTDPTGRVVSNTPVVNMQRTTAVKLPNGQSEVFQGGKVVGPPEGSPTYDLDSKQYLQDQEDQRKDVSDLAKAQEAQIRLIDAGNLIAGGLNSGNGGQIRNDLAAYIETYAPGTSGPVVEHLLHLAPAAAGQEFNKIQIKAAGQDEREAVGGRGGLGLTTLFQKANPSLDLLPDANRDINDLQRVINVSQQDYLQARNAYINQQGDNFTADTEHNRYVNASHFDQQWQSQQNARTYFAAAQALSQKPYTVWSTGLSPADQARALAIAGKVDPARVLNGPSTSSNPSGRYLPPQPSSPAAPAPAASTPTQPPNSIPVGSTATGPGGAKIRWNGSSWDRLQ